MRFGFGFENAVLSVMSAFCRRVLVRPLARLGVTPNQVTVWNLLICGGLFLFLIVQDAYLARLGALAALFAYALADCLDGELARATGRGSPLGAWLDNRCDFALQLVVLTGVFLSLLRRDGRPAVLAAAAAAMASQALLVHYTDMYGGLFDRRAAFWREANALRWSTGERFLAHVVSADSLPAILLTTFRYPLMAAIAADRLAWFAVYIAAVQTLRAIVLHVCLYRAYAARSGLPGLIRSYAIERGIGTWPEYDPENMPGGDTG